MFIALLIGKSRAEAETGGGKRCCRARCNERTTDGAGDELIFRYHPPGKLHAGQAEDLALGDICL